MSYFMCTLRIQIIYDNDAKEEDYKVRVNVNYADCTCSECLHFCGVAVAVEASSWDIKFFRIWAEDDKENMVNLITYQSYQIWWTSSTPSHKIVFKDNIDICIEKQESTKIQDLASLYDKLHFKGGK